MYENVHEPLLPRRDFIRRLLWHLLIAFVVLGGSLLIGWVGYAVLAHLSPVDAFVNAAMILGGMGPVDTSRTMQPSGSQASTRCTRV